MDGWMAHVRHAAMYVMWGMRLCDVGHAVMWAAGGATRQLQGAQVDQHHRPRPPLPRACLPLLYRQLVTLTLKNPNVSREAASLQGLARDPPSLALDGVPRLPVACLLPLALIACLGCLLLRPPTS